MRPLIPALAFLACLLPSFVAIAADPPVKPRRKVVIRGATFPDRIAFLIDASGSMEGRPYRTACAEARRIAEMVSDDGRMRFWLFHDRVLADYLSGPSFAVVGAASKIMRAAKRRDDACDTVEGFP